MKPNLKLVLVSIVAAALVGGCGGGGGGEEPAPDISQSVSALLDFVNNLIACTGENGDLIDVNAINLAVDDTAEPVAF